MYFMAGFMAMSAFHNIMEGDAFFAAWGAAFCAFDLWFAKTYLDELEEVDA